MTPFKLTNPKEQSMTNLPSDLNNYSRGFFSALADRHPEWLEHGHFVSHPDSDPGATCLHLEGNNNALMHVSTDSEEVTVGCYGHHIHSSLHDCVNTTDDEVFRLIERILSEEVVVLTRHRFPKYSKFCERNMAIAKWENKPHLHTVYSWKGTYNRGN
jgi:hypothetical protein